MIGFRGRSCRVRNKPSPIQLVDMEAALSASENTKRRAILSECGLALIFGGVGLIGFCVDAALLRLGLGLGLPAWGARII